jgi:hypothetical protein
MRLSCSHYLLKLLDAEPFYFTTNDFLAFVHKSFIPL